MTYLTKSELEELEQRYGNLFYKAYKEEVFKELERQEIINKFLKSGDQKQDTDRYGHLLDEYIK